MAGETIRFTYNGKDYIAVSRLADTDYGPENKVTFHEAGHPARLLATIQEPMHTHGIIAMYRDQLDGAEQEREETNREIWNLLTPEERTLASAMFAVHAVGDERKRAKDVGADITSVDPNYAAACMLAGAVAIGKEKYRNACIAVARKLATDAQSLIDCMEKVGLFN